MQAPDQGARGGGASVEHGQEPCPDRILDDMGGAFGMGAVGGGVWHLLKGIKNSPSNARMRGGLEVIETITAVCAEVASTLKFLLSMSRTYARALNKVIQERRGT